MKHLFLVLPLACMATLLSGCPDTKLPTPSPKVPTPKAQVVIQRGLPGPLAMHQPLGEIAITARRS